MEWQFKDDRPIYQQIVGQLERAVVNGEYSPGQKLPGVRDLAAQVGVNPNTMQRALAELEARGLLYSQRTAGRFVTEDTGKIEQLRYLLARGVTREYVGSMHSLGYGKEDMRQMIEQTEADAPRRQGPGAGIKEDKENA